MARSLFRIAQMTSAGPLKTMTRREAGHRITPGSRDLMFNGRTDSTVSQPQNLYVIRG